MLLCMLASRRNPQSHLGSGTGAGSWLSCIAGRVQRDCRVGCKVGRRRRHANKHGQATCADCISVGILACWPEELPQRVRASTASARWAGGMARARCCSQARVASETARNLSQLDSQRAAERRELGGRYRRAEMCGPGWSCPFNARSRQLVRLATKSLSLVWIPEVQG